MWLAGHTFDSSGLCFLRFMKIDTLDVRDTGFMHLPHLEGLNFNKFDIRGTQIKHLHPHGATKGIKEVYLDKGQFTGEEAMHLPESVELIYP